MCISAASWENLLFAYTKTKAETSRELISTFAFAFATYIVRGAIDKFEKSLYY